MRDERGMANFQPLRQAERAPGGADLRRGLIEARTAALASILRKSRPGVPPMECMEHPDGAVVFQHACTIDPDGIVPKRLGSRYRLVAGLAQVQKPGGACCEARSVRRRNERRRLKSAGSIFPKPSRQFI